MVGRWVFHNGQRYEITQWDAAKGQVAVSPPDADLADLLRRVIFANMPLLYYYNSDLYCVIHPNLPTPHTTA